MPPFAERASDAGKYARWMSGPLTDDGGDLSEPSTTHKQTVFHEYARRADALQLTPTLRALLSESGEHVFRLAFEAEPELARNFIFAVVVTRHTPAPTELCAWDDAHENGRCVHVCYELRDEFPLLEGSAPFVRLQQTMTRILGVRVRLLPSTLFERSIAHYPSLRRIFNAADAASPAPGFRGLFRSEPGSHFDEKMHAVLDRWQQGPFACPEPPAALLPHAGAMPHNEWNACFRSLANVFWYHAYVYEVVGEDTGAGFGESNVARTIEARAGQSACPERMSGPHAPGQLALLKTLQLVYKHNYKRP